MEVNLLCQNVAHHWSKGSQCVQLRVDQWWIVRVSIPEDYRKTVKTLNVVLQQNANTQQNISPIQILIITVQFHSQ